MVKANTAQVNLTKIKYRVEQAIVKPVTSAAQMEIVGKLKSQLTDLTKRIEIYSGLIQTRHIPGNPTPTDSNAVKLLVTEDLPNHIIYTIH